MEWNGDVSQHVGVLHGDGATSGYVRHTIVELDRPLIQVCTTVEPSRRDMEWNGMWNGDTSQHDDAVGDERPCVDMEAMMAALSNIPP